MEVLSLQKNDMPDKPYTLAGRKGFIHRYADTGFKTKWAGIWFPPYKFFEYFAYNINGEWVSPESAEAFDIKKGEAAHTFAVGELNVGERLAVQKKLPAVISVLFIKNSSSEKKHISVMLEAALNIRTKAENIHSRAYGTSFSANRNAVIVESGTSRAVYGIGKIPERVKVSFVKSESYKEHSPGGEKQKCFLPGKYVVEFDLGAGKSIELPFIFSRLNSGTDAFGDFDKCFKEWKALFAAEPNEERNLPQIITPERAINEAYSWSIFDIQSCAHDADFGTGLFAGYPWFLEFWGRDTFWSLKGVVDAGEFEDARRILRTMAAFQKKRVPCVINLDKTASYHGADVDALFLIALDYYLAFSGDTEFGKELEKHAIASRDSAVLLNYLVQHGPQETWMDSIARPSTAVEIQSFWIEALWKRAPSIAGKMHDKLVNSFWNAEDGFLYDTAGDIHSAKKTSNALFPLIFGQLQNREAFAVLDTAKSELASPFGMRTLSKNDRNYSPAAYHSGASWGFTTAIAACAALNYGKADDGLEYLRILTSDARKHLGGMSECLNSDTGELTGCSMQLWSSALFVHAIDAYLFGAAYNARERKLVLAPKMPGAWKYMERKNKRAGTELFDASVARTKKGYDIEVDFKSVPKHAKIAVVLPEGIKAAMLNGKKIKPSGERSVEFAAGKTNSVALEVLGR